MPRKYSLRNMRKEYWNFADRDFYNHERLQTKTGLAPLSLRQASL